MGTSCGGGTGQKFIVEIMTFEPHGDVPLVRFATTNVLMQM
jgi:hypothetical protein